MEGEHKFNADVIGRLVRVRLLEPRDLDAFLAKAMDAGRNYRVVLFAESLLRDCLFAEHTRITFNDFLQTIELISQIAAHSQQKRDTQLALLEDIHALRKPVPKDSGLIRSVQVDQAADDPPGLREQVAQLFEEWLRIYNQPGQNEQAVQFIIKLVQTDLLRTDDISTRFFRLCTDFAIRMSYQHPVEHNTTPLCINYHGPDAFARLIVVLLKPFGESTKVALLNKVLNTIITVLLRDHEALQYCFNQKPFFRVLSNLLFDVHASDENVTFQVLTAFCQAFHMLRPAQVPAFGFAWLELVSHRKFMPKLLNTKQPKAAQMLQRLLVELFRFLAPFLRPGEMTDAIRMYYRGTLRMLLVLLHDFPEFLADHHFALCDAIPSTCVQMRNLVLSAYPRNMRLPDPFTPNLKIDLLPEIRVSPRILSNYQAILQAGNFRQEIDNYLQLRSPVSFLASIGSHLLLAPEEAQVMGSRYNKSMINALVLYVGVKFLEDPHMTETYTITHGPHMDIFQQLAVDLDTEGRYILFTAIANQLRFPNGHTHFFSCLLLFLFAEATKEIIQEQITRVLLERLIVSRPHPWGLLITFIELIQNRTYNFWNHSFVHCAVEIERLFESVARSCATASRVASNADGALAAAPAHMQQQLPQQQQMMHPQQMMQMNQQP
jgi:CCR4-NOT transcription complex subunit 1